MARMPLLGGQFTPRSNIAGFVRCVNLFPERNPQDAPSPTTHYQRPGLTKVAQGATPFPITAVRGLFTASNGDGYAVIGPNVYFVTPAFGLVLLGQLALVSNAPVSMADNGQVLVIGDASATGYTINLGTKAFAQIVDGTGSFLGTIKWDFMDGFLLFVHVSDGSFGSTTFENVVFNSLFFGFKTDYPDPIQTLIVNRHEIILLGTKKGEIWYNAGLPQFPFAEMPGTVIEHGTNAPYSVASSDISVFWLVQDLQGAAWVAKLEGYRVSRISNHGIEVTLRRAARAFGLNDAIGYTYQQDGHTFYVLALPSADLTLVYDAIQPDPNHAWHQRSWSDADGVLHRDRTNCHAFMYGQNVVGDWQNGSLYTLDLDNYTDAGAPISFVKGFPILSHGVGDNGQLVPADGREMLLKNLMLDIDSGDAPLDGQGNVAGVSVRISRNRGRLFDPWIDIAGGLGPPGQYNTQPVVKGNLGRARWPVIEVQYSGGPAPLNGAWIDVEVLEK